MYVVMQPHHRREGLFGRHRRPGPGALRRGPGGGAQAVRGPQACLGDATGRLRALNGLYFHPFSVLATALDVSITLGWSAGATYAPPPLPPPTLPRFASISRAFPSTQAKRSVCVWFWFACSATCVLGSASMYSSFLLRTTCLGPIELSLRRYRRGCSYYPVLYACHIHLFKGAVMPFRAFPSRQGWSSAFMVRFVCALRPLCWR